MNHSLSTQQTLKISFQEGFSKDEVHILLNGAESCRMVEVSTQSPRRTAILGLSDIAGPLNMEIRLPFRNVSKSVQVPDPRHLLLDVSLSPESEICYTFLRHIN